MGCPAQLDIHRKTYTRNREVLWGGDFSQPSNSKDPLKFPSLNLFVLGVQSACSFLLLTSHLYTIIIRYNLSNLCCQWFDLSDLAALLFWYFCLWSIALFFWGKTKQTMYCIDAYSIMTYCHICLPSIHPSLHLPIFRKPNCITRREPKTLHLFSHIIYTAKLACRRGGNKKKIIKSVAKLLSQYRVYSFHCLYS